LKEKEIHQIMTDTDYSIQLSHDNAVARMEKFNDRAVKAKTYKTMHKNFRIADALYAEYRELIEEDQTYVTLTLDHLAGILND
jgi:hypothetical protein